MTILYALRSENWISEYRSFGFVGDPSSDLYYFHWMPKLKMARLYKHYSSAYRRQKQLRDKLLVQTRVVKICLSFDSNNDIHYDVVETYGYMPLIAS